MTVRTAMASPSGEYPESDGHWPWHLFSPWCADLWPSLPPDPTAVRVDGTPVRALWTPAAGHGPRRRR